MGYELFPDRLYVRRCSLRLAERQVWKKKTADSFICTVRGRFNWYRNCRFFHGIYNFQDIGGDRNRTCLKSLSDVYRGSYSRQHQGSLCFTQPAYNCNRNTCSTDNKLADRPTGTP